MISRRDVIGGFVALVAAALAAPLAGHAQQARIGFLAHDQVAPRYLSEFQKGMVELGYVEGRNLQTVYRSARGKADALPGLAAELVSERVRVIVAHEGVSLLAAMAATTEIPIVVILSANMAETGAIASLGRPGGNVTGFDRQISEVGAKRLDLLKQTLPSASRFAMLADGINYSNNARATVQQTQQAARTLDVSLAVEIARTADDVERAFAAAVAGRPDGLIVESGSVLSPAGPRIAALAAQHRLPAVHTRREFPEAGGLMSYGPNYADIYRRAAFYVDKILKGAKPSEMPVERPTRFELIVNLKTAKVLGITIPQSILLRADEVIE